tara:strand:- start:4249 stop:4359 length:111 start_codon:yes stop_codon:yes gene_type:complete
VDSKTESAAKENKTIKSNSEKIMIFKTKGDKDEESK